MILNIRIAEDRENAEKGDRVDINISSIGHYPFATKFQNSGIKMNGNWTSMSGELIKIPRNNPFSLFYSRQYFSNMGFMCAVSTIT